MSELVCNCQQKGKKEPCPVHPNKTAVEPVKAVDNLEVTEKNKHAGGRPLTFKTPEELQKAIDKYFATDGKERPKITGLARFLDVDRLTLINYEHRDEFFNTIKRAKIRVEEALEDGLYGNSVAGVIFNLKNNFGWKDETKQSIDLNMQPLTITKDVGNPPKPLAD